MERIDHHTVMPEPNEILDFFEVYGKNPGEGMDDFVYFGQLSTQSENPTRVVIHMPPIGHTETFMQFSIGTSFFLGPRLFTIALEPDARPGDRSVIASIKDDRTALGGMVCFVSADGKDPAGQQYVDSYEWINGKRVMTKVPVNTKIPLDPGVSHYLIYERTSQSARNNPLSLHCRFTDDPEHGGEVDIPTSVENDGSYAVYLGPVAGRGMFTPD